MQFEIQKFAAVTIDEAAQASGKIAGEPTVTTYTIDEKDDTYTVAVADGDYTVSGGQYTVTVANSEITAVSTIDGEAVEDWSTAITSSSSVIVPGSAGGEETTFTITAGEAGGYVLKTGDSAITGDTQVTLTTAATDDEEGTTYVITIAGGKVTAVTANGEAVEDLSEVGDIEVPGAVSSETTNLNATSSTAVSYTTFTLGTYSSATYAVTVDDSGAISGLTKDGAAVELGEGNTFTEAGVGEVYTIAYQDGVLTATSSTDETHNLTSASEDGGIVASEKYMKATITVSEGVTVDLTFDPDSKEVTEASGTGIEATYSNNLLSLVTTSEDGATSTTNYTVSVSDDNATATITPTTDGAPTVNQIVSSDSAVEFSTTATFGDFEVSFGTDSKVASVTYTPDTTQQVTFLSDDNSSFMLASKGAAEYKIVGNVTAKSATTASGETINGYVIEGATLTTSEDGRETTYTTTSITDVVTVSDTEIGTVTFVDGKISSVGEATNAASITGSATVDSETGVVEYLGRKITFTYDADANKATATADKNAIASAAEIALVEGQDSLEARNSGEVTIDGQVYTVNVDDNNKVASVYVGSGSTGTKLEGTSEIFTIGDNKYAFTYNTATNVVNVSTSAESVAASADATVVEAQTALSAGYSVAAGDSYVIVDATGSVMGAVDSNNLDVSTITYEENTYTYNSATYAVGTASIGGVEYLYQAQSGTDTDLSKSTLTAGDASVTLGTKFDTGSYYGAGASTGSGTTVFEVAGNTYTINYTVDSDGNFKLPNAGENSGINASNVSIVLADGNSVAADSLSSYISAINNKTITLTSKALGYASGTSVGNLNYTYDLSAATDTAITAGSEFDASVSGKYFNVYANTDTSDSVSATTFDGVDVQNRDAVTLVQYQYNDDLSIAFYVSDLGSGSLSAVTAPVVGENFTLGSGTATQAMTASEGDLVYVKDNSLGEKAKWTAVEASSGLSAANVSSQFVNLSFSTVAGGLKLSQSGTSTTYDGITIKAEYKDADGQTSGTAGYKVLDAADTITVTPSAQTISSKKAETTTTATLAGKYNSTTGKVDAWTFTLGTNTFTVDRSGDNPKVTFNGTTYTFTGDAGKNPFGKLFDAGTTFPRKATSNWRASDNSGASLKVENGVMTFKAGSDEVAITLTAFKDGKEVTDNSAKPGTVTYTDNLTSSQRASGNPVQATTSNQTVTLSNSGVTSSVSSNASNNTGLLTMKLTFSITSGGSTSVYTTAESPIMTDLPNDWTSESTKEVFSLHADWTLAKLAGETPTVYFYKASGDNNNTIRVLNNTATTKAEDSASYTGTAVTTGGTTAGTLSGVTGVSDVPNALWPTSTTSYTTAQVLAGTVVFYTDLNLGDTAYAVAIDTSTKKIVAAASVAGSWDGTTFTATKGQTYTSVTDSNAETAGFQIKGFGTLTYDGTKLTLEANLANISTTTATAGSFTTNAGQSEQTVTLAFALPAEASVGGGEETTYYASFNVRGEAIQGGTLKLYDDAAMEDSLAADGDVKYEVLNAENGTFNVSVGGGVYTIDYNSATSVSAAMYTVLSNADTIDIADTSTKLSAAAATGYYVKSNGYVFATKQNSGEITNVYKEDDLTSPLALGTDYTTEFTSGATTAVATVTMLNDGDDIRTYTITTTQSRNKYLPTSVEVSNAGSTIAGTAAEFTYEGRDASEQLITATVGEYEVTLSADATKISYVSNGTYSSATSLAADGLTFTDSSTGLKYTLTYDNGADGSIGGGDDSITATGEAYTVAASGKLSSVAAQDYIATTFRGTVEAGDNSYIVTVDSATSVVSAYAAADTLLSSVVAVDGYTFEWYDANANGSVDAGDDVLVRTSGADSIGTTDDVTIAGDVSNAGVTVNVQIQNGKVISAGSDASIAEDGASFTIGSAVYQFDSSTTTFTLNGTTTEEATSENLDTTWTRTINYTTSDDITLSIVLESAGDGNFGIATVTSSAGETTWTAGSNDATGTATVNGKSYTINYLKSSNSYSVADGKENAAISGAVDSNLVDKFSFTINDVAYNVGIGEDGKVYKLDDSNNLTEEEVTEVTIDTVVNFTIATADNTLSVSTGDEVVTQVAGEVTTTWTFAVGGETFTLASSDSGYVIEGQDVGEDGTYALETASGTYNVSVSGSETPEVVQTGSVGAATTYTIEEGEEGAPTLAMTNADGTTSDVALTAVTETDDEGNTEVTGYSFSFNGNNFLLSGNSEDGYEVEQILPEDSEDDPITAEVTDGQFTLTSGATEDTTVVIDVLPAGTYITLGDDVVATVSNGTFTLGDGSYTLGGSASEGYSLSNADGAVEVSGSNFNVTEETTAAERNADGSWTIASDTAITNATDEPIAISGAASGTLGAGDVYDAATGTLTDNGTQGDSTITDTNNAKAYVGGNEIDGIASDTTISQNADGDLVIENLPDNATVNGSEIPVTEPAGADGKVSAVVDSDGKLAEVAGVADGATVKPSDAAIETDEGATVNTNGAGDYVINGDELGVAGDNAVAVATNANGIASVSGVDSGASITADAGTPIAVSTDRDGKAAVAINGQEIAVAGDSDGITVTPGEDGVATVSGLDEGAVLGGTGSVAAGDGVYALDSESSIKGAASGGAGIWTADMDALDKAAQDIINDIAEDGEQLDTTTGNAAVTNAINEALSDASATGSSDAYITPTLGGGSEWDGNMAVTLASANDVDLDFSANTGRKLVNLTGEGNNELKFNDEGGNYAILSPGARGEKNITAGSGGDNLMNYSKKAKVTMTGGEGADNIRMAGGADEVVDISSGGADTLDAPNGGRVRGYSRAAKFKNPFATMSRFVNALKGMFASKGFEEAGYAEEPIEKGAAEDGSDLNFSGNTFDMGNGAVSLEGYDVTNGTFVNMVTGDNEEVLMGWGDRVDGTTFETKELLLGNGAQGKTSGSTMMGGTANDTVVAGKNDLVYVSAGSDDIELVESSGAVISIGDGTNDGTTTLNADQTMYGFEEDALKIRVDNRAALSVTFNANSATMNVGTSKLVLNNALTTNGEAGYSQGGDEDSRGVDVLLQTGSDSTTYRARLISGGTAAIADQYEKPTEFYGTDKNLDDSKQANGTGVSYADYTEKLYVNMGDTVTAGNYHFFNIDSVTGGAGLTTLIGNDDNNALIAGAGETTIWGAAGRDSLFGNSSSDKGATTFVYGAGDGMDTIQGFDFGMSDTSDKLSTNGQGINDWALENGKLKIQVGENYDDQIEINGAAQQAIKMNLWGSDFDVEVGTNAFTYREGVDFYLTKESAATLNASSSSDDELAVMINGWDGKAYDNVTAINASGAAGNASLVGSKDSNSVITGGSGHNSLWGGEGGDDTLIGGSGSNEFFYCKGNGNDVINNANANDVVNLFGISIDDIDFENSTIDSGAITVALNEGGKLTVNSSNDVTFKVADGSEWHAVNRSGSNAGWDRKNS